MLHLYSSWFLLLVGILVPLSGFGGLDSLALATSAKQPVVHPLAPEPHGSSKLPKADAKPQVGTESTKMLPTVAQRQKPPKQVPRKINLHKKAVIEQPLPAVVEPKPDLSYHGILEKRQRYDPSRERRAGRPPNPQADEILHDHFQELDKNHDGLIDPFERAFGRLDMNRDVSNYQWEYSPPPRKSPLKGSSNRLRKKAVTHIFPTGSNTNWSSCHALLQFRMVQAGNSSPSQYCGIPKQYLPFPLSAS